MLRNFRFWYWIAIVFQFLTAAVHSIGLFVKLKPLNDSERRLFDLMDTYHFEMGAGFTPTMGDLFTSLSSTFTLLCVFAGLVNAYLLRSEVSRKVIDRVLLINVAMFGVCLAIMAALTFLLPIISTALIFSFLLIAAVVHRISPEHAK